jgi:hypothetical protein
MKRLLLFVVAVGISVVLIGCRGEAPKGGRASDLPEEIERIEETTESFANAMLDLSVAVKTGNRDVIRAMAADEVVGVPLPLERGQAEDGGWFSRLDWVLDGESTLSGDQWLERVEELRARFNEIEDVRFKVKASEVAADGESVDGGIAFWLVARDSESRREWVRGKARVRASLSPSGWKIGSFDVSEMVSMVATVDIFSEVAEPAGLDAVDPPYGASPAPPYAAHGAAAADVNLDGLIDLAAAGPRRNFLYLNRGDGTFSEVATEAHMSMLPVAVTAPLFLDYDNDGDQDLFFAAIGEQILLENRFIPDGRVDFMDVSFSAKVARHAVGFSAVAGDVDGNGFTDIYVASYNRYGVVLPDRWDGASNGTPNLLFLNRGDGSFDEVAEKWGAAGNKWSYAAGFADVDDDHDLDLYVANDYGGPNDLFINVGDGFEEDAKARGVSDGGYGMGVDFGDFDNDGDLDLHVTRMSSTAGKRILSRLGTGELPSKDRLKIMAAGNALYENLGDGHFRDVSAEAGPFSGGWAWGGGFIDIDNDGHEDLFTPNGFVSGPSLKDT